MILWAFQLFFNRFDFSTDAFKGLPLPYGKLRVYLEYKNAEEYTNIDRIIRFLFRGFTQWDAAHMLHIAEHGYVLESSLAFYPLYPLAVR